MFVVQTIKLLLQVRSLYKLSMQWKSVLKNNRKYHSLTKCTCEIEKLIPNIVCGLFAL